MKKKGDEKRVKKLYTAPDMLVISIDDEDIICTSPGGNLDIELDTDDSYGPLRPMG